jgi:hypothetical protein
LNYPFERGLLVVGAAAGQDEEAAAGQDEEAAA